MVGENFYKRLPIEMLADFYFEIQRNIDLNILSDAMYGELNYIKEAAIEKGYSELDLYTFSKRAKELGYSTETLFRETTV